MKQQGFCGELSLKELCNLSGSVEGLEDSLGRTE
jgi:hypothetical protein